MEWMVYGDRRIEKFMKKVRRVAEPRVVGKTVGQRRESKLS